MEKLVVEGGHQLEGRVRASGSKNAALPILIATLLAPGEHRIANVPELADTMATLDLLGRIGCPSLLGPSVVRIDTSRIAFHEAPYDVVRKMRASVLVLGPLLARAGEAIVSLPGGCAIGVRPIDQHLRGLEALGARFELTDGCVHAKTDGLRGAEIRLDMPTVTGTENILMAAVAAEGTTVIDNAAREPEVVDLGRFLIAMGARIEGLGTDRLVIDGVARLVPTTRPYAVCADRIETGTWLAAAAATGGDVEVYDTDPTMLGSVLSTLTAIGCDVTTTETTIRVRGPSRPQAFELTTEPFPGFPTDMQAQLMIAACLADGTSRITETIFENRFMHCAELLRMGARISTTRSVATIEGQPLLRGSPVMASDLRASAALVIAGLAAQGMTEILRIYHLDRGYERIVEKLRGLNGRIARVSDAMRDREELRRALDRPPTAP